MNGIREKFSRRRLIALIMFVGIAVFTVAYALIQTKTSLAVLTAPPPGIPGPYYVTAEAKIYGPVVDLAMIKSKMSGQYASDYTYVQWGANPFYRVYVDNTLQEVYYGQMIDIMDQFNWGFAMENNLKNTCNNMKISGALDPASILGKIYHFGNLPGSFVAVYNAEGTIVTNTTKWYATEARVLYSAIRVELNNTICVDAYYYGTFINASGGSAGTYNWNIYLYEYFQPSWGVTLYFEDLLGLETTISNGNIRIYTVIDSPGTGFVSKYVSPSSPVVGTTINVTVRLDPPSAEKINITDLYPNTFTWASVDVLLEKFKVDTGSEETVYVNVVPAPEGSNMTFTIYYNQAPSILQSLLGDEYIYLTYSLRVPDVAGEYTLPPASMSYLIPTPQV